MVSEFFHLTFHSFSPLLKFCIRRGVLYRRRVVRSSELDRRSPLRVHGRHDLGRWPRWCELQWWRQHGPVLTTGTGAVTINHISGIITRVGSGQDLDIEIRSTPGAFLDYNHTGGEYTNMRLLTVRRRTDYTLDGGTLNFGLIGGERVQTLGSFTMLSGTVNNGSFSAERTTAIVALLGGTANNLGSNFDAFAATSNGIRIGGDFTVNSIGTASDTGAFSSDLFAGSGTYEFDSDWTGSIAANSVINASADPFATWNTMLTNGSVTVGGTAVTSGNFGTFFQIGSNNELELLVPEPSVHVMLTLSLLYICRRRRDCAL